MFAPITIFNFYFAYLIDIIDITSPELQPMAVQYTGHRISVCITYVFAEYDLTTFIQNCIYMNFRIILTQYYINFTKQEHQIDVLYVSFNT